MKHIIILLACILSYGTMQAQLLNKEAFSLLNLEHPGLEEVKKAYHEDKLEVASQELLKYYRQRTGIVNPFLDVKKVTISPTEQKWADDALQHTFFVHKGYQPSFNYGKDINWQYWPVRDNELRWQLHRHKWFTPMGKAYWLTKDEKYAKEWAYQFMDWIKKNPLQQIDPVQYEVYDVDAVKGLAENIRFAWRPLEASGRLKDQINQFTLFLHSQAFTPEFLTDFLVNYSKHAHHTLTNYSEQGNHLLFEAEYVLCAGIFFPEFTEAPNWRKSGIDILNREIKKQVYADGGQYELDLGYHGGCINIFSDAFAMAKQNGYGNEFPDSFVSTIKKMMQFSMNVYFPDYTFPCFSDASRAQPFSLVRNYQRWSKLFPDDEQLRYFATQGKEGKQPAHLCHASVNSGFFTFRNGWKQDAVVMTLKAGPKGEWHCQPDNGTFELWFNGKNLFPDSGSFIYGGDEEVWKQRNWFRQTAVHNTLTLDNKNIETTQSVTKLWKALPGAQVLVTENPGYKELTHRRSVFFVDNSYFVIVDEAIGNALGTVNLHYQLCDGKVDLDKSKGQLCTRYAGNSNVLLRCFGPDGMQMVEEEGWYSIAYRQRTKRPAVAFNIEKKTNETVRYITVIHPQKQVKKSMKISASIKNGTAEKLEVEVNVDGKKRTLSYELEQEQWATHDDFGQDAIINPSAATYHFDIATGPVKGNDESLATNYQCPEWFRDAKFGIYMHWGLNSIAGYDGHYGRWMYWYQEPDSSLLKNKIVGYRKHAPKVYQYHLNHFGHPSKFGYKDFIPLWKATRFNADSLATFYKEIGAKFIGVMAVHHDNFDLYDSSHQPWNSVNMGPKTDIVGAWKRACEKAGVYFAITSHLSNYCHEHMFYQGTNADPEGPYAGVPYDYMNPAYEGLYGKRTADRILRQEPEFAQQWYERTKELVSKYDPDLLYFDGPLPNGIYGQQLAAHFYNTNLSKDNIQQGVLTIKRPRAGFTLDRECSGVDDLQKNPFLVDTTVNPGWFYMGNSLNINEDGGDAGMGSVSEAKAKDKLRMTAGQIVDNLVDIVSKNGNMMLNVGLRADGSLPEAFRDELVKIGKWLKLNGEAIYETRPYNVYGEGSSKSNAIGDKKYADNLYTYTAEDFRFTTKKEVIYVIAMDWPGNDKTIKVKHLNNKEADKVKSVTFVANGEQLKWQQKEDGLYITMPSHSIGEYAYAFKVNVK